MPQCNANAIVWMLRSKLGLATPEHVSSLRTLVTRNRDACFKSAFMHHLQEPLHAAPLSFETSQDGSIE
jgi:hypothetical protein